MRHLLVKAVHLSGPQSKPMIYTIHELESGQLMWVFRLWGSVPDHSGSEFKFARTGNMSGMYVEAEEAEALTGLYVPAAWDRLREMIHESTLDLDHIYPHRKDET